jgi:dihydroxyacetone kinase-like predicted kinase
VVALCPAGGLADLFRAAGADPVVVSDDDNAVATELTAAVCEAGARSVVVLPNARAFRDVADAAAAAARSAGRSATVVPTRSPVQGLAAVAVHDPGRRADDDAVAMSAAAAATRYAEVTRASYDALTSAGPCRAGDVLGLIDDDVATIGDEIDAVARELLDRLLIGGGELVTIVLGADTIPSLGSRLSDYVRATRPAVEAVVHHGGQPTYPVMLGVE